MFRLTYEPRQEDVDEGIAEEGEVLEEYFTLLDDLREYVSELVAKGYNNIEYDTVTRENDDFYSIRRESA